MRYRNHLFAQYDVITSKIIKQAKTQSKANVATARIVTSLSCTLTGAYFFWMLRGGVLLASLLSSLPAWHQIDLLYVLENYEKKNKSRKRRKNDHQKDDDQNENAIGSMID